MPQLDPTWFASQLFWLLVSLVLLYIALARFVLPRLIGAMDGRANVRQSDIDAADIAARQADDTKIAYESALKDARIRADSIFLDAQIDWKKRAEMAHATLEREVHAQINDARTKLESAKQAAKIKLGAEIESLTISITQKLAGVAPSAERVHQVIEKIGKGK